MVAFALVLAVGAQARHYYLLSVGVADYPGTANDLRLPSADARAMAAVYQRSVGATVKVLVNGDATKANILSEARRLFSRAGADDVVIFFFSGHGTPGAFCAYDYLLEFGDVRAVFAACRARSKMLFADSCFSGDIREGRSSGYSDLGRDIMLFLSCRSDEYSIERPDMKNGFFTACLVRCLKGGADSNKDRIITARELFTSVRKGVVRLSRDKQHPVMWGNFSNDMQVINWKKHSK